MTNPESISYAVLRWIPERDYNRLLPDPVHVTVGGHHALQDETRVSLNNTNLVFLHTIVEDADRFYQILAWTTKSE